MKKTVAERFVEGQRVKAAPNLSQTLWYEMTEHGNNLYERLFFDRQHFVASWWAGSLEELSVQEARRLDKPKKVSMEDAQEMVSLVDATAPAKFEAFLKNPQSEPEAVRLDK